MDTGRARAEGEEMSEPKTGLASLGLDNAIRLRWVLRDIIGKRLKFSPIAPNGSARVETMPPPPDCHFM